MGRSSTLLLLLAFFGWCGGCSGGERIQLAGIVREGGSLSPVVNAEVRADGEVTQTDADGRFEISVSSGTDRVRVKSGGLCPQVVTVDATSNREVEVELSPVFEMGDDMFGVGYDQEVSIQVRTLCDDDAHLSWRQVQGPELGARMSTGDGGRVLTIQTHALTSAVNLGPTVGAIAIGRQQRLDYRFVLETELSGTPVQETVRVTAGAVTTGGYQVTTGTPNFLNGGTGSAQSWEIVRKPEGSESALSNPNKRVASFVADVGGEYQVRHVPSGRDLLFVASEHNRVPRDCAECHEEAETNFARTLHARTFQRGLEGELGRGFSGECLSCHASAMNPGFSDGGFDTWVLETGFQVPEPAPEVWAETPESVQQEGSVWCSSCHGMGRQLPGEFHWEYDARFEVGLCQSCHDAVDDVESPHQSWHVQEWAQSSKAMGSAGEGVGDRDDCAGCHTTEGFLATLDGQRPTGVEADGISCVACHDPHGSLNPDSLRVYGRGEVSQLPATSLGAGAICSSCHRAGRPTRDVPDRAPHAPQGNVILGRGSLLVPEPRARGEHAVLADSCVACHMADPGELRTRAGAHTFSVRDLESSSSRISQGACAECHGTDIPPQAIGGIRDFDRDGRADNVGREFARAFERERERVRQRIRGLNIRGRCDGRRFASDFAEHERLLVLTDSDGRLLGDCDASGSFEGRERPVTVIRLAPKMRRAVWDLALLSLDGSEGSHNPSFSFEVLRAVRRSL